MTVFRSGVEAVARSAGTSKATDLATPTRVHLRRILRTNSAASVTRTPIYGHGGSLPFYSTRQLHLMRLSSLICGNIGCGRYDEAHAFSHFEETSHCYAMDIDTKRVWDYAGDGYVHRLIENRSEGKVMDRPDARAVTEATNDDTAVDGYSREKVDHLGMEYTHLLTSQLDSQRLYFEQKVAHAADKAKEASHAAEVAVAAAQQATEALEKLKQSHEILVRDTIPSLEQEKARAGRRAEKSAGTARKLGQEWSEEKAMNENLMERVNLLGREVEQLKTKAADLEEQNRDLTFFISGQAKLESLAMGEEVQDATVTVGDAPKQEKKRKGKGKGKA